MTTRFRDVALSVLPRSLRRQWGDNLMLGTFGLFMDLTADLGLSAVAMPWLRHPLSADDAVPKVGADSGMPQYPGESIDAYRARVVNRWPTYQNAGSEQSLIEQLLAFGFSPATTTIATLNNWAKRGAAAIKTDGPLADSDAIRLTESTFGYAAGSVSPDISTWTQVLCYVVGTAVHATSSGTQTRYVQSTTTGLVGVAWRGTVSVRRGTQRWLLLWNPVSGGTFWFDLVLGVPGTSLGGEPVTATLSGDVWTITAEFVAGPAPTFAVLFVANDFQYASTASTDEILGYVLDAYVSAPGGGTHHVDTGATLIADKLNEVRFLARCDADRPWLKVELVDQGDYVFVNTATREIGATVAPGGQATVRARRPSAPWVIVRARFWPQSTSDTVRISLADSDEGDDYSGDGSSWADIANVTVGTPEPIVLRDNEVAAPDRLNWWSQFWIVVPEGTHPYTSTIPADDQVAIGSLVHKWKPAQWDVQRVEFTTGGTVAALMSGRTANEWAADLLPQDHSSITFTV